MFSHFRDNCQVINNLSKKMETETNFNSIKNKKFEAQCLKHDWKEKKIKQFSSSHSKDYQLLRITS